MNKVIYVLFVNCLMLFNTTIVYGYDVTDEGLVEISNKMNKTMPRQLDKITSVTSTLAKPGLNLEINYEVDIRGAMQELAKDKKVSLAKISEIVLMKYGSLKNFAGSVVERMHKKEVSMLCTNKERGAHRLINKGIRVKHVYYDEHGTYISSNIYDRQTCQK